MVAHYTQIPVMSLVDSIVQNSDYYNFTTNELSDRLAVVLGSNVNRTREIVSDSRFTSKWFFVWV